MQIATPAGARYFVLFKDDFSGWTVAHFMKNKSEVESLFQAFVARVENETKRKVRILRSDNGGEFIGKTFADWLAIKGIKHETSAPHSPEQNGVAERSNRTIMEAARSLLHSKGIPCKLWAEAVNCAVYTLNRILSRTGNVTPYETWYGRKPDISHLRIFGSKMYIHIPDESRQKLDAKSFQCIFMGYCDTSKAYRGWDPVTQKIKISRDVLFDEQPHPIPMWIPEDTEQPKENQQAGPADVFILSPIDQPTPIVPDVEFPSEQPTEIIQEVPSTCNKSSLDNNPPLIRIPTEPKPAVIESSTETKEKETQLNYDVPHRRSARVAMYNEKKKVSQAMLVSAISLPADQFEPLNYQEAISCEEATLWESAIKEEYLSLIKNGTWILVPLPAGQKTIKSQWIFKVKPGLNGAPPRFKARLVAKGYTQRQGIDYGETYAPVVTYDSLRVILSTAAALDLELIQLDIKTAFLY